MFDTAFTGIAGTLYIRIPAKPNAKNVFFIIYSCYFIDSTIFSHSS